jgi:hypothetical protein
MRFTLPLMLMIAVASGGCAALHSTYDGHVRKSVNAAAGFR